MNYSPDYEFSPREGMVIKKPIPNAPHPPPKPGPI